MEPKNILQVSAWFQKEAPSSKLKSTPPTGAPNAAATPAAAPPDTKSRFSWSWRKNGNVFVSILKEVALPCDIPA